MNNYTLVSARLDEKIKEKYFRKNELDSLHVTDPAFFLTLLSEGKVKLPSDFWLQKYCLDLMQGAFHVILRRYLKVPEKIFSDVCRDELVIFSLAHKYLANENFDITTTPAKVMITLYGEMKKFGLTQESQSVTVPIGEKIENSVKHDWQNKVICFLESEVKESLESFVKYFFIHGSFATHDYLPAWSDLDVLVFLKEDVFESEKTLLAFKRRIEKLSLLVYKIDPLAHHEFIFFTEFDRLSYPSFLFPPILYSYSRDLLGQSEIKLCPRVECNERIAPVMKIAHFFRRKVGGDLNSIDQYSWKNDLSLIMLFPSLLLEAVGIEVYKKFSFEMVKERFPELDFSIIDQASSIRNIWKRQNFLRFYPSIFFLILPVALNRKVISLHRKLFSQKSIDAEELEKKRVMYKKFLILVENSLDILLKF